MLSSGSKTCDPEAPRERWPRKESERWPPPWCLQREPLLSPGRRQPGRMLSGAPHFASPSCPTALPAREHWRGRCRLLHVQRWPFPLSALQARTAGMSGPAEKEQNLLGPGEAQKCRSISCRATKSWLGPFCSFDRQCFQKSNRENKPPPGRRPYFHLSSSEHLPRTQNVSHDARGHISTPHHQVLWLGA